MITVQYNDKPVAITVRGGVWDDDIFDEDWCNHAGAEVEEVTSDAGLDSERTVKLPVCDKCGAQFIDNDDGGEWLK